MEGNAACVDAIYDAVKAHEAYQNDFSGKPILIVLNNAPAHSQTEGLVRQSSDLVLLRLGPYSPMCNPIEGCFSALKTKIKSYLALRHDKMLGVPRGQMKNCACSFSRRQLSIAWLA
ncbi:hypothetical protein PC116_g6347 [Phytophthora cactorum]|nr:hypothetical protein PC111_g6858 [Phytophthora cactorum]KAG2922146.1 hypothetical protein PC114_g5387 [Phytophthora cactorum]KAG2929907.1 hypothetical protein PC115_g6716 [Phytophthora cactorum]KAG2993098.1 hypothetical protein PC118_g4219 [Phytophthora cactorum]KAG3037794.1 hypothetical protein PC119_g3391 [Phytophthora cactorum]